MYLHAELGEETVKEVPGIKVLGIRSTRICQEGTQLSTVDGKITDIPYFHRRVGVE